MHVDGIHHRLSGRFAPVEHAMDSTPLLEGGLAAVKEATSHLETAGIGSWFTVADGCKAGS